MNNFRSVRTTILLIAIGAIFIVSIWPMFPIDILLKLCILAFVGVFMLIAPGLLYDKIIQKQKKKAPIKAMIFVLLIFLLVPVSLNGVYFYKLNDFKYDIENCNLLNVKFFREQDLISNHSVGNEWEVETFINGRKQNPKEPFPIDVKPLVKIRTSIVEHDDSVSDYGNVTVTTHLTPGLLNGDETVSCLVSVFENRGRYKGNEAVWEVEYKFERVFDYWDVIFS